MLCCISAILIGGSIDVPLEERGDVNINAADGTACEAWVDPVKAQRWVVQQLAAQGIKKKVAA